MAKRSAKRDNSGADRYAACAAELARDAPVAGVPGPGQWLIADYVPASLFSLKISLATSSVGKTLLVPTPYAIKMSLVDAAFRAGLTDEECAEFLRSMVDLAVRISPPEAAVVTHTFLKVRQESRDGDPLRPYGPTIAYREVVHHRGVWHWAFDLAAGDVLLAERLVRLVPYVSYIGKRSSFIQFRALSRRTSLDAGFTQPLGNGAPISMSRSGVHIVPLDDFGPEADLAMLSSFTKSTVKRDKHRRFVQTIVPLGLVNTGPGFSEYRAGEMDPT